MSTTTAPAGAAGGAPPAPDRPAFQGNDKLLLGLVLAVLTFWLFAGTVGTVAPRSCGPSTPRPSGSPPSR